MICTEFTIPWRIQKNEIPNIALRYKTRKLRQERNIMICYNKILAIRIDEDLYFGEGILAQGFDSDPIYNIKYGDILKYSGEPVPDGTNTLSAKASFVLHKFLSQNFATINTSSVVGADSYRKVLTLQTLTDGHTFDLLIVSDKASGTLSLYLKKDELPGIADLFLSILPSPQV